MLKNCVPRSFKVVIGLASVIWIILMSWLFQLLMQPTILTAGHSWLLGMMWEANPNFRYIPQPVAPATMPEPIFDRDRPADQAESSTEQLPSKPDYPADTQWHKAPLEEAEEYF